MKININDIPLDKNYEGYLWLSNSTEPHVYINEKIDRHLKEGIFIVEGQLYNSTDHVSFSIKYVDGEYCVLKYEDVYPERDKQKEIAEVKSYLSNRMDGKWLKFLRYWEAKPDENCEGMSAFTITKNVFIGFKK